MFGFVRHYQLKRPSLLFYYFRYLLDILSDILSDTKEVKGGKTGFKKTYNYNKSQLCEFIYVSRTAVSYHTQQDVNSYISSEPLYF